MLALNTFRSQQLSSLSKSNQIAKMPPQKKLDRIAFPKSNQKAANIKFGFDPMTWVGLTTTAHFYKQAIDWTLKNIRGNTMSRLKESTKFKNGQTFLELANSCQGNDRLEYIRKAESSFLKASDDYSEYIHKGEAYKYAAICAKILNRDTNTVDQLAEKAGNSLWEAYEKLTGFHFDFSGLRHDINNSDIAEVVTKLHSCKRLEKSDNGKLTTVGDHIKENCTIQ